jgi:hypothetical protein
MSPPAGTENILEYQRRPQKRLYQAVSLNELSMAPIAGYEIVSGSV